MQDRTLFVRRTWDSKAAETIKTLSTQQFFLHFKPDPPHEDYETPPPWGLPAVQTTIHTLLDAKARLSKAELSVLAREALQAASVLGADIYYTDGSVNPHTKTSAAAFTHEETTAHYRLSNGSSTLQTELLAIQKALQHADPEKNR